MADTPQAIAAGQFSMDFDPAFFGDITDVQVFSSTGDAIGKALIDGKRVDVTFSSASGGIGRLPELPIATVAIAVLAGVAPGAKGTVTINPGTQNWRNWSGARYVIAIGERTVTAGGTMSIQNVTPGGGLLPAGAVVRVEGSGFTPATILDIRGVAIGRSTYVSPSDIDVTLAGPAELTGKLVRATNTDGTTTDYISGLRAIPFQPATLAFRPFFPIRTYDSIDVGRMPTGLGGPIGFAVENQNAAPVTLTLEHIGIGGLRGRTPITIPAGGMYVAESLSAFGIEAFEQGGLLATSPIRAVLLKLSVYPPVGGDVRTVHEALAGYTKFENAPPVVSPEQISFQYQTGTAAPAPAILSAFSPMLSIDPLTVAITATTTTGGPWLSVSPLQLSVQSGTTSNLTVRADPSGLAPGTYTGTVSLLPSYTNKSTTVPVTLHVSAQPFIKTQSVSATYFSLQPGDTQLRTGQFSIVSSGANIPVSVSTKTDAGLQWLSVASSTVTTPSTVAFSVNPAGLPAGAYNGTITVAGPSNSETINVSLAIAKPPVTTLQSLSPSSVELSVQAGSADPARTTIVFVQPFTIGRNFLLATHTDTGGDWLKASVLPAGAGGLFSVDVNSQTLSPGTYSGTVTVTAPGTAQGALILPVKLTVWDGVPALSATPASLNLSGDTENPPSGTVTVTSGDIPVEVTIQFDTPEDSCTAGASTDPGVSPPRVLTPVTLTVSCGGAPGDYNRNLILKAGDKTVTVPVSFRIAPGPYRGITTPPVVSAIVNAASNLQGAIAPGEIIAIHGSGVGSKTPLGLTLDVSGAVTRSANGSRVLINGTPAPIVYSSVFQSNVIVPYEVGASATASIQIDSGGSASAPVSVPVAAASPAVFTIGSSGIGRAAVLNEDNSVNSVENAAARGSTIQIFATGEGQTIPPATTGAITHSTDPRPALRVKLSIGGVDADLKYAGAAPEAVAGLFQVNAVVPLSVPTGPAVPILINIGDATSQPGVAIAIR